MTTHMFHCIFLQQSHIFPQGKSYTNVKFPYYSFMQKYTKFYKKSVTSQYVMPYLVQIQIYQNNIPKLHVMPYLVRLYHTIVS